MNQRTTHASIQGKLYPINTDYRTALRCVEVIHSDVDDEERALAIITMLFGIKCPLCDEALEKAELYLTRGNKEESDEQLLDYKQDWNYIYSAFQSQYGINLDIEELHYERFIDLLTGIKDQILNDVVYLRDYDISEIKDRKQREKMIKAKKRVALTKEEQRPPSKNEFMETYFKGRR